MRLQDLQLTVLELCEGHAKHKEKASEASRQDQDRIENRRGCNIPASDDELAADATDAPFADIPSCCWCCVSIVSRAEEPVVVVAATCARIELDDDVGIKNAEAEGSYPGAIRRKVSFLLPSEASDDDA